MSGVQRSFAHTASVLVVNGPVRAIGESVSALVCGQADHAGPCPLAPHHISLRPDGHRPGRVRVRVVFLTDPHYEQHVRQLIGTALALGRFPGPDRPVVCRWELLAHRPSPPRPEDYRLAAVLRAQGHRIVHDLDGA